MADDDNNYQPVNSYQDDLDNNKIDPLTTEESDDPVHELGIPARELKAELDRLDGQAPAKPNPAYDEDDMREEIEDLDEDDEDRS